MRTVRGVGHVGWWIFVVGSVMVGSGYVGLGQPRRYADYLPAHDYGWTAYTPLTDSVASPGASWFTSLNIVSTIAVVALGCTVVAAVVEAVLGRRWVTGVATVIAPILGAVVIGVFALGDAVGRSRSELLVAFFLVLVGVAIREVWSRGVVPRLAALQHDRGSA